ncbi:hypothetical protein DPV78_011264 [Talaromyces pinophilus]|nr:hypothetical protein DPV78_011264 [Talaromyces pinophilus]
MQNSFCHEQGSFAKIGAQSKPTAIIPHINELRSAFRTTNTPVFFLRTAYNTNYSNRHRRDARDRVEQLQGLIQGSWDADILCELKPEPGKRLSTKREILVSFIHH